MKAGYQTTEFWLGLIGVILTYLNQALGWNIPVASVLGALALIIAYIASRTYLKSKQPPAV